MSLPITERNANEMSGTDLFYTVVRDSEGEYGDPFYVRLASLAAYLGSGGTGDGDVEGPVSSTDNAVARYHALTGKVIQNSVVIITDAGALSGVTTLAMSGALTGMTTGTFSSAVTADDLYLYDTNASHTVLIHWNEDEAGADRILNIVMGGADRTLDFTALGDVSAGANITDHSAVRGDGGAKGVQGSVVIIDDSGNVYIPEHLGVGSNANVDFVVYVTDNFLVDDNDPRYGVYNNTIVRKTSAAMTDYAAGLHGQVTFHATNDKDWTNSIGLRGVEGVVLVEPATTDGGITGAASFYASASLTSGIGGKGTVGLYYAFYAAQPTASANGVTNAYGLYIEAQTVGTNSNYSIYTNAGTVRFGGTVLATNGALHMGVDDTQMGWLTIYGHATGSANGGRIYLYTAFDHHAVVNNYYVQVSSDLFQIGDNAGGVRFTLNTLGNIVIASGGHFDPADASGQDLGDGTHRWDLYTQEVIWGGATGNNLGLFPDNLADALSFKNANGDLFQKFISTTGALEVYFGQDVSMASDLAVEGLFNVGSHDDLVLDAAGAITVTKTHTKIDTFGGAATDDLVTINGGTEGDILILHSTNNLRDVTVKVAGGNIRPNADYILSSVAKGIILLYMDGLWREIGRY